MSYQVDLIYGITYTRNDQITFPANLTGVKKVTINCEGKFFTYQRTIRAYWSAFSEVTYTKNIVGARVIPDNGEEFYYFVTGFAFVAPNVVEFNIEPDYFHTYLKLSNSLLLYIERTNIERVCSDTAAFFKSVTTPRQDKDPVVIKSITTPITDNGNYDRYSAVLYALGSERTIFVTAREPDRSSQPDTLYNLIKATKFTGQPVDTQSPSFEKNIKALRAFWLPRQLAEIIIKAGDGLQDEYVWYSDGNKDKSISVISNYYFGKIIAEYSETVNLPDKTKYYTIGTVADNISVKSNYLEKGQVPKVKVNLKLDTNSCNILLRVGEQEIDCTRGFEYDCNVDNYAQQLSQVGISNAIQKVSNAAAAAGSVGAGIAAASTGNFLQAALNITGGLTAFGKQLSADYELKNKVTATSGNNIGTTCWAPPYYGIAVLEYSTYDENEVINYTNLFGAEVNGYEYNLPLNAITSRVFIQARKVDFLNVGIPAPAAVELEQTFISGIFISPFITQ